MNSVFGMPLLLNFLTSSVMVCFVGFQMTLGLSADHTVKLALFLISATVEIYLICYFSGLLIVSVCRLFNPPDEPHRMNACSFSYRVRV